MLRKIFFKICLISVSTLIIPYYIYTVFHFFSPILNAFYNDFLKLICTIILLYIFTRFLTFNFSYNFNQLHYVNFLGRFLNFFTIALIFISLVILSYIISCIFISGTFMNQQENKFESEFVNFTSKNTDLETIFFSIKIWLINPIKARGGHKVPPPYHIF